MKILFSFQPIQLPLVKLAHANGHEIMVVNDRFHKMLTDLDIPCIPLHNLARAEEEIIMSALKSSVDVITNINGDIASEGLSKNAHDFMKDEIAAYLYNKIPNFASLLYALDRFRPDVVVLHNDVEPSLRLIAMWAAENGIPCIHVPHAVYIDVEKGNPGDDIHDIITATYLAAASPFQAEWYAMRGFPPDNIVITGSPKFDKFSGLPINKRRAQGMLGLNPRRPVVTYASSWRQNTNLLGCHDGVQQTYQMILQASTALPQVQFVIKLHPSSGDAQQHQELASQMGAEVTITQHHLEVVLQASDLVFSYGPSNLLMEASYIPWVRLMCTHGYEEDNEVIKVGREPTFEEVIGAIKASLSMETPRLTGFRNKYCGPSDGNSSKRIMAWMEALWQK